MSSIAEDEAHSVDTSVRVEVEPELPREPVDPVAVGAIATGVLLLGPVCLILAIWARRRARMTRRRGRLGWIAFAMGLTETALAVAFWIVYFAVLAPILALPTL